MWTAGRPLAPAEPDAPDATDPEEGEALGVAGEGVGLAFDVGLEPEVEPVPEAVPDVAPCMVDEPDEPDEPEMPVPRALESGSIEGPAGETKVTAKLEPLLEDPPLDPATEPPDWLLPVVSSASVKCVGESS